MKQSRVYALAVGLAVSLATAVPAAAQCPGSDGISLDSVRGIALRLHPAVLDSTLRRSYAVVTLVFDSSCRVVHHSLGYRRGPNTLASRDPQLSRYRLSHGGTLALLRPGRDEELASLRSPAPFDDGRPQVAWAFLEGSQ